MKNRMFLLSALLLGACTSKVAQTTTPIIPISSCSVENIGNPLLAPPGGANGASMGLFNLYTLAISGNQLYFNGLNENSQMHLYTYNLNAVSNESWTDLGASKGSQINTFISGNNYVLAATENQLIKYVGNNITESYIFTESKILFAGSSTSQIFVVVGGSKDASIPTNIYSHDIASPITSGWNLIVESSFGVEQDVATQKLSVFGDKLFYLYSNGSTQNLAVVNLTTKSVESMLIGNPGGVTVPQLVNNVVTFTYLDYGTFSNYVFNYSNNKLESALMSLPIGEAVTMNLFIPNTMIYTTVNPMVQPMVQSFFTQATESVNWESSTYESGLFALQPKGMIYQLINSGTNMYALDVVSPTAMQLEKITCK